MSRETLAGPFKKTMHPLQSFLLVILFFVQFEMATNMLRNIIVIGGSFVGRVSIEKLSGNELPLTGCKDNRTGACKSHPTNT
jgi:hypothetical protein